MTLRTKFILQIKNPAIKMTGLFLTLKTNQHEKTYGILIK